MLRYLSLVLYAGTAGLFLSCTAPKEEVKTPEVKTEKPRPLTEYKPETKVYEYSERYFVRKASIAPVADVEDPLQALRVVQLKEGPNEVLVLSRIDEEGEAGSKSPMETWLAIELPDFSKGSYPLGKAVKAQFHRFYLGEGSARFDGTNFDGVMNIDGTRDGYLIGWIKAVIKGERKSFETETTAETIRFSGSFRIEEVPLEATIMGGKK